MSGEHSRKKTNGLGASVRALFHRVGDLEAAVGLLGRMVLGDNENDSPRSLACGPESPLPSSPAGAASSRSPAGDPKGVHRKRLTGRSDLAGDCRTSVQRPGTGKVTEDRRRACGTEEPEPDSPGAKKKPDAATPGHESTHRVNGGQREEL
jgi:hypothetical protein